ncbi:hypothetical protein D3C73_1017980 [compost metagenome]
MPVHRIQHGGLQPAEAEIIGILLQPGARKLLRLIRLHRKFIDMRSSGIRESQRPGDFVISFAYGVVPGAADQFETPLTLHMHQLRMSAGHDQSQARIMNLAH